MPIPFSSFIKTTLAITIATLALGACSNTNSSPADTDKNQAVSNDDVVASLQKNLDSSGVSAKVVSASKTEVNGLYWVTAENIPAFFSDAEGKYIFQGNIIEVGGAEPVDISAKLNAVVVQEALAAVDKKDLIIFPAEGKTVASIYVFTDPTCPYCRKFDEQIPDLNKNGVEVRYLAWPRSQQALPLVESIWCSEDRNKAMTQSMQNIPLEPVSCDSPVRAQTELGHSIGVAGTPAVYTESGEQLGGYVPTAQLLEALGIQGVDTNESENIDKKLQ